MGFHPNIAVRGALIAAILVVLFTSAITTGATLPDLPVENNAMEIPQNLNDNIQIVNDVSEITSKCEVSQKFPDDITRWCEFITKYSEKNNLPVDLIAALIWQESGGIPKAYSKSGAVGLMQIMPSDGIAASFVCVNGPCFTNRPTIRELKDPEFNIRFGTNMLARLIKKKGNLREALKSYGPMDVGYSYADKVLRLYRQYGN